MNNPYRLQLYIEEECLDQTHIIHHTVSEQQLDEGISVTPGRHALQLTGTSEIALKLKFLEDHLVVRFCYVGEVEIGLSDQ